MKQGLISFTAALLVTTWFAGLFLTNPSPSVAGNASLSFSPSQGDYAVNSTIAVSILVNTGSQAINTVDIGVLFPPDKLQVVNPTVNKSFVQIWTNGPSYSNTDGTINFQGGLPAPGINTSAGVVSTVEFRVKSSGKATIKFTSGSKILANDGNGTEIPTTKSPAILNLQLAPPGGPTVSSPSHPDQSTWYKSKALTLVWETPGGASGYSYVLDTDSSTEPTQTVNTTDTELKTELKEDGLWYFHIRANNQGAWGGTTHFAIRLDTTPPAAFTPRLERTKIAANTKQIATFTTTDSASGIDHYEIRLIARNAPNNNSSFFTEEQSPYQLPGLNLGSYQFVVRAFDRAGNSIDGTAALTVGRGFFALNLPSWLWLIIALVVLLLIIIFWLVWRRRHRQVHIEHLRRDLESLRLALAQKREEIQEIQSLGQGVIQEISQVSPTASPSLPVSQYPSAAAGTPTNLPQSDNTGQGFSG